VFTGLTLALILETWWVASLVLRFFRGVIVWTVAVAAVLRPNVAFTLGGLSLAILCHVGCRGLWHLILDTSRRCRR
jgi:hypothetical protein